MLVAKYNVAFRTSHKIVGALVKALIDSKQTLNDVTPQMLQKVAMESAGVKLVVKSEDIVSCTNLRKVIETYKVQGGPSPAEVERALKTHKRTLADNKQAVAELNDYLATAENTLNKTVKDYSLSSNQKA